MKKDVKGSITIEAAVIVPIIMGVFIVITWILFYYHDKNVIAAVSHETVVMMSKKDEIEAEQVESYFQNGIRGKLLMFVWVDTDIQMDSAEIHIVSTSRKNGMRLCVEMKMKRTEPEKYIRNIRRIGAIK